MDPLLRRFLRVLNMCNSKVSHIFWYVNYLSRVIVCTCLPGAFWDSPFAVNLEITRIGHGESWREWILIFKSSSPGKVITKFSSKVQVVSSHTGGQATSGVREPQSDLGFKTVIFLWVQPYVPMPSSGLHSFPISALTFKGEMWKDCRWIGIKIQ